MKNQHLAHYTKQIKGRCHEGRRTCRWRAVFCYGCRIEHTWPCSASWIWSSRRHQETPGPTGYPQSSDSPGAHFACPLIHSDITWLLSSVYLTIMHLADTYLHRASSRARPIYGLAENGVRRYEPVKLIVNRINNVFQSIFSQVKFYKFACVCVFFLLLVI